MLRSRLLISSALLVAGGCSSLLEPAGFVGSYTLEAVNAHVLPATVSAGNPTCTWSTGYGALVLGAKAFTLAIDATQSCAGSVGTTGLQNIAGGLSVTGSRNIALTYVSDAGGGTTTLSAVLDDSTVTIMLPTGLLGVPAPVALRFSGRSQGVGCAC